MKREDYITWDQYFMGIAILSAQRSKDPNTQVGCCIVDENNRIVSMGYNGFPNGILDEDFSWERQGEPLETKYMYVCHAELNAILNTCANLKNCTLYVTLFPCNECTKAIIQKGIKKVVYLEDKHSESDSTIASKRMLSKTNIIFEQFQFSNKEVLIKV